MSTSNEPAETPLGASTSCDGAAACGAETRRRTSASSKPSDVSAASLGNTDLAYPALPAVAAVKPADFAVVITTEERPRFAEPLLVPVANGSGRTSGDEHERTPQNDQFGIMSSNHKLDIRATQRTFEGAYLRTALGQLSFSLVIIKIFSREFLPIGAVFTVQGILLLIIALYRRHNTIKNIFSPRGGYIEIPQDHEETFQTSGPTVFLLATCTILTYITLLVLILRLKPGYGDS